MEAKNFLDKIEKYNKNLNAAHETLKTTEAYQEYENKSKILKEQKEALDKEHKKLAEQQLALNGELLESADYKKHQKLLQDFPKLNFDKESLKILRNEITEIATVLNAYIEGPIEEEVENEQLRN